MTSGLATFVELSTVIGVKGLYDLLEIAAVNAHNDRVARKLAERNR